MVTALLLGSNVFWLECSTHSFLIMATIHQRIRSSSSPSSVHKFNKSLSGNPLLKGICLKTLIVNPKKPNSARRKIVYVKLSNGSFVYAYIPGISHNLQEHSIVFVRGGRLKDCPAVHYKCIRGKGQLLNVPNRRTSLSKY